MKRSAFTLIELLVVIAIIAILAAILFPVFAQAKLAAKKAVDISNTKEEGLAAQMYFGDNDDMTMIAFPDNRLAFYTTPWNRVPPASQYSQDIRQTFWTNSLYAYKKNYQLDATPVGVQWNLFNIPTSQNPQNYADGYTYNSYLNTMSATAFTSPSDVVVFWPGFGAQNAYGYGGSYPLPYLATGFPVAGTPAYQFASSGPNCMASLGIWSGGDTGGYTYNLYSQGFNMNYADSHSKYVVDASGRSPWAAVDAQHHFTSYWVNSADAAAGCGYDLIMSPFFTGS